MLTDHDLQHFANKQWAVLDSLLSFKESQNLYQWLQSEKHQLKPARIGSQDQKNTNTNIRSDSILWIEPESNPAFSVINEKFKLLSQKLREEFYLPIQGSEFHFAHYQEGSFYSRHLDQPKSSHNRLVSIVHYLNPTWEESWGGQIVLYTEDGPVKIAPQSPATLIFQSHKIEHEVLKTNKDRFSLTGWLYSS